MKKQKLQSLTIVLGAILSLAIVCSQLFHIDHSALSKKEIKTEQQETERTADETISVMPSFSLPSSAQIQVSIQSYCLFEISFEKPQEENHSSETPLQPEKFLKTLFNVIISPNAP